MDKFYVLIHNGVAKLRRACSPSVISSSLHYDTAFFRVVGTIDAYPSLRLPNAANDIQLALRLTIAERNT